MSEQDDKQATTLRRPTHDNKEAWKAYWKAQGQLWRTEPEIDKERRKYLEERCKIKPDWEQGIFPYKDIKLNRADVEWLLATHQQLQKDYGIDLHGADLREVDFYGLPLARTDLGEAHLERTQFIEVHLEGAFLYGAFLEGAFLYGANLQGANLIEANLQRADLQGADLHGTLLYGANLQEADLHEADLQETYLCGANLTKANLHRTNLFRAHLEEAYLKEARLEEAVLTKAHLEGAQLNGTYLESAYLPEAHLEAANLYGAHLEGARLTGAHLERAGLHGANLQGAYLTEVHLERAGLHGANLQGADLSNAHLESAHLIEANLQGADLSAAHLEGANLTKACLEGANLFVAHLEGANLRSANLQGVDFRETHLEGATLHMAHLEGATLEGAHLGGKQLPLIELNRIRRWKQDFPEKPTPTDLRETFLSNATRLKGIILGDGEQGFALLADIYWGDTNLAVIDWTQLSILGDESEARKKRQINSFRTAVRANRQLAVALQAQGLNEEAARFAYRSHICRKDLILLQFFQMLARCLAYLRIKPRAIVSSNDPARNYIMTFHNIKFLLLPIFILIFQISFPPLLFLLYLRYTNVNFIRTLTVLVGALFFAPFIFARKRPVPRHTLNLFDLIYLLTSYLWQYIFSLILNLLSGYGYKPIRTVIWYIIAVFGFTLAYTILGRLSFFPDALVFSIMSFHGRGFFPSLSNETHLYNAVVVLAASQAIVGLFIEISFIATFTQRFFGK